LYCFPIFPVRHICSACLILLDFFNKIYKSSNVLINYACLFVLFFSSHHFVFERPVSLRCKIRNKQ
jgi:hypothetical protein